MKMTSIFKVCVLMASTMVWYGCSEDEENSGTNQGTVWNGTVRYGTESTTLDDNCVNITWTDSAKVEIASNIFSKVAATIRGGNVTLLASEDVAEEVTYILSGTSSNGSFYMDGSYKATVALNGLTLTSSDSAAINIRDGKRIAMVLVDGTVNSLTDASGGSHKACLMVKGHTEMNGNGSLTLTGRTGHAFWGKEYLQLKAGLGQLTVKSAVGDGINVNQFFQMNGGTVDISNTSDDGLQVNFKTDDNDQVIPLTEDEENTAEVLIKGGTLTITTTEDDSKGIKTEGDININESKGTVNIKVVNTGNSSSSSNGGNMGHPGSQQQSSSGVASKAIKAEGDINVEAGNIIATSSSSEGIESKATITINGGMIYAQAYDDAINSGSTMTISGGHVCAYSTGNDGIDANGNFYMKGGTVYAIGTSSPEVAIDANTEGGYQVYLTGGNLVAIGGLESGSNLSQSCYSSSSWSKSTWYALYNDESLVLAFKTPSNGGTPLVVSTAGSATLRSGVSTNGGTSIFNGMGVTGGSASGGSSVSLSTYSSGGGMTPGGGGGPFGR